MRVIAGRARRIPLKCPQGNDTRPTTDRIKETLFNIIQDEVTGARFLDLYAGSGGIGIEALSRGAEHTTFVERSKKAVLCIRDNLKRTKLSGSASVMVSDVIKAIELLKESDSVYDIIFADPPYKDGVSKELLNAISDCGISHDGSLIILEADMDTPTDPIKRCGYTIEKVKEYKTNKHIFIRV